LSSFLANDYYLSPPVPIPASLLVPGYKYNFYVTLTNFLGTSGSSSKEVLVVDNVIPSVAIEGSNVVLITRKTALSLSAKAFYYATCGGEVRSTGMSIAWSVFKERRQQLNLLSTSKNVFTFKLPAYSFASSSEYEVKLTANILASLQSSSMTVKIIVEQGIVQARISGGAVVTARVNETSLLDASGSSDEDQEGVTGTDAGLSFTWTCSQINPLGETCSFIEIQSSTSVALYIFRTLLTAPPNSIMQVALMVEDPLTQRSSSAHVQVRVISSLSPSIFLSSNTNDGSINGGKSLRVTADVSAPSSTGATCIWVVDDATFDLPGSSLTALQKAIGPVVGSTTPFITTSVFLSLIDTALTPGTQLTFTLFCNTSYGGESSSAVNVIVNQPPSGTTAMFAVWPINGTELTTAFTFTADKFHDTDLPITYQFGYSQVFNSDSPNDYVVLRSRKEVTFVRDVLLPAGLFSSIYYLAAIGQIFDSLDAVNTQQYEVLVQQGLSPQAQDELLDGMLGQLNVSSGSVDVDSLKQSIAYATYLMNIVNCSAAPNCTALHRQACSSVANTCGKCISPFIGDSGAANSICVDLNTAISTTTDKSCTTHSDCSGFDMCEFSICTTVPKQCPTSASTSSICSGNGVCKYEDLDTGNEVDACFLGDDDCRTVCVCNDTFSGLSCGMGDAEVVALQERRNQLFSGLATQINNEDVDETTVHGWSTSLENIAGNDPTVLSAEQTDEIADNVAALIARSEAVGLTSASNLLGALNMAVEATSYTSNRSRRRRRLQGVSSSSMDSGEGTMISNTSLKYQVSLSSYGEMLLKNSLVPGQSAIETIYDSFRMR
jgi:hypothetical protein